MAVITKKDEKVKSVVESLSKGFSENDFIQKFKEMYEKDWKKRRQKILSHSSAAANLFVVEIPDPAKST